ncbi:MAG: hypothetical protein CM15mP32_3630 [Flavobacteriaceae bacterium]|nr:MAG: hypothetical protein CM15mP32_3630 [Flavobacteriaceae bacterium]
MHELIEEIKPSWVDDFPLVNTIVRNPLIHMHEDSDSKQLILTSVYKDDMIENLQWNYSIRWLYIMKSLHAQLEGRQPIGNKIELLFRHDSAPARYR